jgi:hypothetical protein
MIAKITTATVPAHRFAVLLANVVRNYNSSDHRMIQTTPDKGARRPFGQQAGLQEERGVQPILDRRHRPRLAPAKDLRQGIGAKVEHGDL